MQVAIIFLTGFVLGGLVVRWLMMGAYKRGMRTHELDEQYHAAKRAVARHLRTHGTLNLEELERMMDIPGITAMRYLDQMVRDRVIKAQGHRGKGAFYTRV
jgi:hypothetical protein